MNRIVYNNAERDLLAGMVGSTPRRVLGDGFYQIIFDYGSYHIYAKPESLVAATQNKDGEAIQVRFSADRRLHRLRGRFSIGSLEPNLNLT